LGANTGQSIRDSSNGKVKDSRLGKMTYSIDDRLKDINGEKLTDSGDDIVEGQQCQKDCEQK
jgi:hypothetical protein